MSKAEENIARILQRHHIKFEREKTFDDLGAGRFRYDFFLPNFGNGTIIEFNGAQHYMKIPKFHATGAEFAKGQEHDRRKISYALSHKYPMYCIPFWDEESIKGVSDLFKDEYRVSSRWHNDLAWREHQKSK